MFPLRTLALVVSAGLLAGCAVGPDYHRPDAPLAERYQAQSAVQQRSASRPATFAEWWDGFDDPLLSQFVADALAQNLDLAQATARMAQARAGLGAATAALLPSGNISGQAARAYQSAETPLGQVLSATQDYNRYGSSDETNLNASWEIDVFGGCDVGDRLHSQTIRLPKRALPQPVLPSRRRLPISISPCADYRHGCPLRRNRSVRSRNCWKRYNS
ncbi:hypothetical protein ERHA54_30830 [Erwinia rhapontici]|nr:hypothetical protein ERHA54_30830 [Erwinia rhapontici]